MAKKILISLAILAVLAAAAVFGAISLTDNALNHALEENYVAAQVMGDARLRGHDRTEWVALKMGTALTGGDTIRTGADGRVDVLFENGRAMRITPNSTVMLASDKQRGDAIRVLLSQGRVLARAIGAKAAGAKPKGEILQVQTPVATMGIRGTSFSAGHDEGGRSQLLVRDGVVNMRSPTDSTLTIDVPGGLKSELTLLSTRLETQPLNPQEWRSLKEIEVIPTEVSKETLLTQILSGKMDVGQLAAVVEEQKGMVDQVQQTFEQQKVEITRFEMGNLRKAVRVHTLLQGRLPVSLAEIDLESGNLNDSWGTNYLYYPDDDHAVLLSAGPDKRFGSDDDLRIEIDGH